jgi:spore coat protein CotH
MNLSLKIRRHYPLLIGTVLSITALLIWGQDIRVIAYTVDALTQSQDQENAEATSAIWGSESVEGDSLFDLSVVHSVSIDMDPEDYENMILTYQETEEKDYYPADIIIDGNIFENVGIRLKGNSSLRASIDGSAHNYSENYETPFLIKFDEYEEDQSYLGYTQIALRSQFNDPSAMQEILGYWILGEMGIPAPQSVYTTVNLNDEGERLYILTEVVTEEFLVDRFDADSDSLGDLFKNSGGANLNYVGEDPLSYGRYELKTNENESDVYDIIALAEFIDSASDEELVSELNTYLDVDTVINYLAFCNVLVNLDSFAGNANNYYLYQDPETDQFTVIPWDLNEAFGAFGMQGKDTWALDLFFEGNTGNPTPQNNPNNNEDVPVENKPPLPQVPATEEDDTQAVEFTAQEFTPKPQNEGPRRPQPPQNFDEWQDQHPITFEQKGGLNTGSSTLMTRLFELEPFRSQYLAAVQDLLNTLFSEEVMFTQIDELEALLSEANDTRNFWDSNEVTQFESAVDDLKNFVAERNDWLEADLAENQS